MARPRKNPKPRDSNAVGARGEAAFEFFLTKKNGRLKIIFEPAHLGGKFPFIDFYVTLKGLHTTCFFLVQAKATNLPRDAKGNLKISINKSKYKPLLKYRVPVYIVGIEEEKDRVFIMGLDRSAKSISSISTKHNISRKSVQDKLYDEVKSFWKGATHFTPNEFL
jgi:hypothetical protein